MTFDETNHSFTALPYSNSTKLAIMLNAARFKVFVTPTTEMSDVHL